MSIKRFGVFALLLCMACAMQPALAGEAASDVDGLWRVESWVSGVGGSSYNIDPSQVTPNPFPIIIAGAGSAYYIELNDGLGVEYEYQPPNGDSGAGQTWGRIDGLAKISDRAYQKNVEDSIIDIVLSGDGATLEISERWDYGDGLNGSDVITLKRVTSTEQPTNPTNPTNPPTNPTNPPANPTNPQAPANPNEPQEPGQSGNGDDSGGGCSALDLGFGVLALAGVLALSKKGGKR